MSLENQLKKLQNPAEIPELSKESIRIHFEEENKMKNYDIVIIGGGPAGLSAAVVARKNGTESVLILNVTTNLAEF